MNFQPQNYRLQYNLAFAELLDGKIDAATDGFLQALLLHPDDEDLTLRIFVAYAEHSTQEERLNLFRSAVMQSVQPSQMLCGLLAECYLDNGQPEAALVQIRSLFEEKPDRPFVYLLGIKALCLLGRYQEALAVADTGITVLPADGHLHLARAMVLRDMEQPERAMLELDSAQQLLPGDAEVARQRALVFGSVGKTMEAVEVLKESLLSEPENPEGLFWLSYFLIHRKRFRDAFDAVNHLLVLMPASVEGHLLRGAILRGLKRVDEAKDDLSVAALSDTGLVTRMSADPALAELLGSKKQEGLRGRIQKVMSRYWRGARRTADSEM